MAVKKSTLFLLAGAGALLLMSSKKSNRRSKSAVDSEEGTVEGGDVEDSEDLDDEEEEVFESEENLEDEGDEEEEGFSAASVLSRHMDPGGRAQLGMLYQIKQGDTPLEICREALFGSRDSVTDAAMRQAAKDLLVRIDCGPWNQALYGVSLEKLKEGHANIDSYFTQRGVSFNPIYKNNRERILNGLRPTSGSGGSFALIWIPMINLDRFDMEGVITTEGMYYEDTPNGMGGSMIDPPEEILDLEFDEVSANEVGCDLPEGDFRRSVVAN